MTPDGDVLSIKAAGDAKQFGKSPRAKYKDKNLQGKSSAKNPYGKFKGKNL